MKVRANTEVYKNRMKEKEMNFSRLMMNLYQGFGFEIYQCSVSKALNDKTLSLKTHMALCKVLDLKLDDIFILTEE
ncbi:hypothetical protein C4D23_09530 [Clostridium perfringens]